MDNMFLGAGYSSLTLSGKFANSASSIKGIFFKCTNLVELNLQSFNTGNFVDSAAYANAFDNMMSLKKIKIGVNWNLAFDLINGFQGTDWVDGAGNHLSGGVPLPNTTYFIAS